MNPNPFRHGHSAGAAALLAVALLAAAPAHAQTPAPAGSWQTLELSAPPLKRHENAMVEAGGRLYLLGGRGERPVEAFDPRTRRWSRRMTPPLEMHHFQGVEYDGKIYVLGALTGRYPHETPIPHVYIYDPATNRWEQGPEIPADRRRGAAGAVLHDGLIYLVSGIQDGHSSGHVPWLDTFNPRTGEWKRLPDAPRARDHFQAAVLNGKLYAAAGRRSSAVSGQTFQLTIPEVDVYDLATGRWTTLPAASNLPTQRAGTASVVHGGKLLVLGGESGSQQAAHREVEAFGPATGRWQALAPMIEGRHGTQAVLHGGKIHIAAGSRVRGATEINSHEVYTPGR